MCGSFPNMLFLLLIGVTRSLNKYQLVLFRCWDMVIDVSEKLRRIAVGEAVKRTDQQSARVGDILHLRKISLTLHMNIVQHSRKPVIGGIGDALHPPHEVKRQKPVAPTFLHLASDIVLLTVCHTAHHVSEVRRTQENELLHPCVCVTGKLVNDLVRTEGMSCENDVLVTQLFGVAQVGINIIIGVRKALVPRADDRRLIRADIHRFDLPEGIVCLSVNEVETAGIQRIPDVIVKRI